MKNIFTKSKQANNNYLSKVIRVDNIRPHSNADRLDIITVDGGNIIVKKDSVKIGDIMIYCVIESALNKDFLSKNNQFEDKDLNSDQKIKGFFNKKCRVRAINLKGESSRGFLFPPEWLKVWQPNIKLNNWENYVDVEFDTVNDVLFSKKYIVAIPERREGYTSNKRNKKLNRFDKLVQNQFNFHIDTLHLGRNIHKVNPDDIIQISSKWHGTSFCVSNILVNRKLNFFEKILSKFGVKIEKTKYDNVYSSRTVIKNRYVNKNVTSGFYSLDIWGEVNNILKSHLNNGQTIYGECVGYLPNSTKMIQKGYDYGCNEGEFKIYIYRITTTTSDGNVIEWGVQQVKEWCLNHGFISVKELYYGKAKDLYPDLELEQHWHQNFLYSLQKDKRFNMEELDPDCITNVPFEGIVLRKEKLGIEVYKCKCDAFFQRESEELDNDEIDMETAETIII